MEAARLASGMQTFNVGATVANFLCCKMTLGLIPRPVVFLTTVREVLAGRRDLKYARSKANPDRVVVMNPTYEAEVQAELREWGLGPELLVLD